MKKAYIVAAASLFLLTACDSNDVLQPEPAELAVAQISATIGNSVSRAYDKSWEEGDEIGIIVTTGIATEPFVNVKYTTPDGDGEFEGEPIYIYNPMSLTAYYPFYGTEGVNPRAIAAKTDAENQAEGRQSEIDFLFAYASGITSSNRAVRLNFAHRMCKLTLSFSEGDGMDISKISSYTIDGLVLDGTFDVATGTCATAEDGEAESLTINTSGVTEGKELPSVILFPQEAGEDQVKLTVTDSDGQIYVCNLNFADQALVEGNNYRYAIKVSKKGLEVQTTNITDWQNQPVVKGEAGSAE